MASKCCKIFEVCLTILGYYVLKGQDIKKCYCNFEENHISVINNWYLLVLVLTKEFKSIVKGFIKTI